MKTRGRPKGSEKDDSKALNAIADMLYADPELKPTRAIKRNNPKVGDSEIRRLQVKIKERKEALLAAAKLRADAKERRATGRPASYAQSNLGAVAETARMVEEALNSPGMRAMRQFQESPSARAIWELQNSPTMRTMRELQNSPGTRLARELQDSPTMHTARAFAEAHEKIRRMLGGF